MDHIAYDIVFNLRYSILIEYDILYDIVFNIGQVRADAMEARARTVRVARTRAGETAKRRRLAARDGAPADAAP